MDYNREPRRFRHLFRHETQDNIINGTPSQNLGPEPVFQGRPHGMEFRRAISPGGGLFHLRSSEDIGLSSVEHAADEPADTMTDEAEYGEVEETEVEANLGEDAQVPALGEAAPYLKFCNGTKRKRSLSIDPSSSAGVDAAPPSLNATAPSVNHKRGRKAGGPRKGISHAWTDAENIALLELYVDNPRSTHKAVADMHHAKFWASDPQWEGRSFSACQQRMIALNSKSRDREKLTGVLAEMKSAAEAAGETGGANTGDGKTVIEEGHGIFGVDVENHGLGDEVSGDLCDKTTQGAAEPAADGLSANAGAGHPMAAEDAAALSEERKSEAGQNDSEDLKSDEEVEPAASNADAVDAAWLLISLSGR